MNRWSRLKLATALMIVGGCSEPTGPKTVASKDLSVKIPAFKHAAETKDRTALAEMVRDLNDNDAAVRLYAIEGLHRLTGEDFGYHYYDDAEARKPAVEKWRHWLEEQKH
jgi:hypothetical protein